MGLIIALGEKKQCCNAKWSQKKVKEVNSTCRQRQMKRLM